MEQGRIGDTVPTVAMVLYLLFLPLYPITVSLMGEATSNLVIAIATVVNVLVTGVYAFFRWGLWKETRTAARIGVEQIALARQEMQLRLRPYVNVNIAIEVGRTTTCCDTAP